MQLQIPNTSFRLKHGFAVRPGLELDKGPEGGLVMGQNVLKDEVEAIYLGKQAETPYRNVWMDTRGAHVLYVMGKRRSGKSYTLGVLAEGLGGSSWIKQGTFSQGVLILDTMNVYITMPFGVDNTFLDTGKEIEELRKWKLETESINTKIFHPKGAAVPAGLKSTEVTLRPSDFGADEWCGLFEVDPFADPLGNLITELYSKVKDDGYISIDGNESVPPNPTFHLDDLLIALDSDQDLLRYHQDTREALRRRLDAVKRLPIFSEEGLDVRQLLMPGTISIMLLRDLDQQMRSALVALIVKQLMQLRGITEQEERMILLHLARAEKLARSNPKESKREEQFAKECRDRAKLGLPRSWLIIDEAHNYIPSFGSVPSRKPLKKYVDEGRNLGLSIVVATQQPSGLDPSIQRNADMLLIHALSHRDDIKAAEGMINTGYPEEVTINTHHRFHGAKTFESLVRNLPLGYALASTERANRLFPVCIRPRITVHGGTEY